jgi:RNA polymerase sigma factor (sigma-70 family)
MDQTLDLEQCLLDITAGGRSAERAMARLYDEFAPRFVAFMRMRAIEAPAAEEIVQEIFLRLIEMRSQLGSVAAPRAYLWQMLRNAVTDYYRSEAHHRKVIGDAPGAGSIGDECGFENWVAQVPGSDGLEAEREDLVRCIARALEALRSSAPDKALAIDLAAIEGFTGHELAEALGRTYGATRQFLSEARKALEVLARRTCGALLP